MVKQKLLGEKKFFFEHLLKAAVHLVICIFIIRPVSHCPFTMAEENCYDFDPEVS